MKKTVRVANKENPLVQSQKEMEEIMSRLAFIKDHVEYKNAIIETVKTF